MLSLDELARQYFVYEKSDTSDFQRKARILQSRWREEQNYKIGEHRGKKRGNYLLMPWAKETLSNYLSDTIKQVVRDEVINNPDVEKLYCKPRIFNNLLSSQPLCFNLFAELKADLQMASKVFNALSPDRIEKVTKIEFEYSPGRSDLKYTGDRSASDVYVEFLSDSGKKGFIGIEVKYHENLQNKPAEMRQRYFEIASQMGCFKKNAMEQLQQKPLEQIWRDHMLAGSILQADDFDDGFFVFLYPEDNNHCNEAIKNYRNCLTDSKTFEAWVVEDVVAAIQQFTQDKWIYSLYDRYLNFDKLQKTDQK
ncbi:MAG: hypothetical protein KAS96_09320 [Planctomycetes bacterium]|nr:hypothetical protein [Planctomycetota bacterium]